MDTIIKTDLANRLMQIQTHFKLNDTKLAEIAGVTPTAIGNIINGVTDNPKISLLKNISSKLNISLEWLVYGEGSMLRNSTEKPAYPDNEVGFLRGRIIELEGMLKLALNSMSSGTMGKLEVIRLPRVSSLYFFGFTNISNNILSK